jgi:hypothetical protein
VLTVAARETARVGHLVRAARRCLWRHPRLLVPALLRFLIDVLLVVGVVAAFQIGVVAGILALVCAVCLMALTSVFADAIVVATVSDLASGEPPSLQRAWRSAWRRRAPLAGWAPKAIGIALATRFSGHGWFIALRAVPAVMVTAETPDGDWKQSSQWLGKTLRGRVSWFVGASAGDVVVLLGSAAVIVFGALSDSSSLVVAGVAVVAALFCLSAFVYDSALAVVGYSLLAEHGRLPLPPGITSDDISAAVDSQALAP